MVASPQAKPIQFPPSEILSDEPPLETERHLAQIILLLTCLKWWWRERPDSPQRDDFYVGANMTIYYSPHQRRSEDFRGPDFFVVLGTQYKERKSWVLWEEGGKYPNVIIEMLSETTAKIDRGEKKEIYQEVFRTPEYYWFDPYSLEFQGFALQSNGTYREMLPDRRGRLWSEQLELYIGIVEEKLRFLTVTGEVVPTPSEAAIAEKIKVAQANLQAEVERQRAEVERQRAEEETLRAEAEHRRAEEETLRAEAERQRAEQVERQLERLKQQMQEQGINFNE